MTSRSWRPRWTNPRRSRPGRAMAQRRARPPRRCRPARRASIVIRASQPNPAATGKQARRARRTALAGRRAAPAALARFRAGSGAAAVRLTMPKPPPCCSANAATARSDVVLEQRPEVADQIGVAERAAGRSARRARPASAPGPCRAGAAAGRARRPPRPRPRSGRASRRRRRSPRHRGTARGGLATVRPMRPSSSRAAIEDRQALSHRRRGGRDVGQDAVACGLLHAVLPRARPRRAAGRGRAGPTASRGRPRVARSVLGEGLDRGVPGRRHLDPDRRHVRRGEPVVEAGEKARRRARSAGRRCGRRRSRRAAAASLPARSSTRSADSACQSGLSGLGDELAAEPAAQLADLPRGGERREGRAPLREPGAGRARRSAA